MFEERNTEEIILKRMMEKIPNHLDKREGSIIYNALAPTALELAMAYSYLDRALEYSFITKDTPDMYIEKRVNEIGMKRKQPTKAIKKAMFYDEKNKLMDIPLNSRFSIDSVNFRAMERLETGIYKMECEMVGEIGNSLSGNLIPIDYIKNLAKAELKELIDEGREIEEGSALYYRFAEKEQRPTTSGNPNHYRQWALEVNGVGKCKVYPLWNGEGTVKLVIVDSNRKSPSKELIDKVYKYIDEVRPIGPKVTISGAKEKNIDIKAKVKLLGGVSLEKVQQEFIKLLDKYFKEVAFEASYLSIAKIGNILLNTPGIGDYQDLKINNEGINLSILDEEIPTLGVVVLEV